MTSCHRQVEDEAYRFAGRVRQTVSQQTHSGSIYAAPGSTAQGLAKLKQVAAAFPKMSEIYIYCGCCPIAECPNIRPAFQALQGMGFRHLHV